MAIVWDAGGGGGGSSSDWTYTYEGTDGTEADSAVVGSYNGESAVILQSHATITKIGPVMVEYDPLISSLFGDYL